MSLRDDLVSGTADSVITESDAPRSGVLSRRSRQLIVGRCSHALYRWYLSRSQTARNWSPDSSFDWRKIRQDHSERLATVIEGFYAVEQYAPDYTAELTKLARAGYGRSQFQIRWGAEEEKHADLWRNVLLFSRARTPEFLESYTADLRKSAWAAPFDSPLEMLFYTVFQERATQLIYLRTAAMVRQCPESAQENGNRASQEDPVLHAAITTIAIDEAAHYDFFLSLARLYLYYFPDESLMALVRVVRNFVMPAALIVPNYEAFITVLYQSQLFGPRMYGKEVAKPALSALGVDAIKEVEEGILRSRQVPCPSMDAWMMPPGLNVGVLESTLRSLFDRVTRFEDKIGLSDVYSEPLRFEPLPS